MVVTIFPHSVILRIMLQSNLHVTLRWKQNQLGVLVVMDVDWYAVNQLCCVEWKDWHLTGCMKRICCGQASSYIYKHHNQKTINRIDFGFSVRAHAKAHTYLFFLHCWVQNFPKVFFFMTKSYTTSPPISLYTFFLFFFLLCYWSHV